MPPPSRKPRIVVGPASRTASTREKLLALLVLIAVVVVSVTLTRTWTLASNQEARQRVGWLNAELDAAQTQLDAFKQQLAVAQRGDQVTRGANDQLRKQYIAMQGELAGLRADIEFYQRLLGAAGAGSGLAVHGLQLQRTASPLVYRFELTLSQNLKKARVVAGRAELLIDGVEGDRARTLDVASMKLGGPDDKLSFKFKYFQLLRGSFALPEGFIAERARIRLVVRRGRTGKPVWREFNWPDLIESVTNEAQTDRVQ